MWRWTFKSLVAEPLTLLASIAAAAFAFLLVLIFEAIYAGETEQIVAYVDNADADVWVMQSGVSNMHMATSYLTDWKMTQVSRLPGVAQVDAILYMNTVISSNDRSWFAYIVGIDQADTGAGPWEMAAGRAMPAKGEAVVPEVFARVAALELGDILRITDRDFEIVGFSAGTFSMANSVVFVARKNLQDIMDSIDIVSYLLVKAAPGISATTLAATINTEVDKVNALPAEEFIANDRRMALQMGVETIALITFIGGALAALLVAFTVNSHIARQRRELAVAKALGATNRSLYASVSVQAIVIALGGVLLAVSLALITTPLIMTVSPQVTLKLTAESLFRIVVIGIGVALLASLVPARQIARVDPLSAFQE